MNYAELSQAISDWLNKDSIDKVIPMIIRFGQRDLEDNLRIRPMEYHPTTATVAAATASLALPSDFLELIYLQLILSGARYPIECRESPLAMYSGRYSTTETGLPQAVTRIGDDLFFDVLLDVQYTRDWSYYRRLPVLVASVAGTPAGNSNWWSESAEEAFLMSCLNKASLYVTGITEGDKKKWADAYALNLDRLRLREARETTGGNIIRSSNWK
jgi:hypothetical protein